MSTRPSIATLLLLSAALLIGCHISHGTVHKTSQVTRDQLCGADEQQDTVSQITPAQRQEELRLANERTRLADEKAELEKQKREFAEKRLEQQNKSDEDEDENPEAPSEDKGMGGS